MHPASFKSAFLRLGIGARNVGFHARSIYFRRYQHQRPTNLTALLSEILQSAIIDCKSAFCR